MPIENTILLTATTFGSFYLCATSLQQINKIKYYNSLASYCNFFVFGFSSGLVICVTKYMFKNIDN